jgi:polyhydroxyalkanoate synthesis regulator phasin
MSRNAELMQDVLVGLQERNAEAMQQTLKRYEEMYQGLNDQVSRQQGTIAQLQNQVRQLQAQVALVQQLGSSGPTT